MQSAHLRLGHERVLDLGDLVLRERLEALVAAYPVRRVRVERILELRVLVLAVSLTNEVERAPVKQTFAI